MSTHDAACSCGQLRLTAEGDPIRVSMCHCLACQRRTGSAFGIQARFPAEWVRDRGSVTTFVRGSDESDEEVTFRFCPDCGATVFYTLSAAPDAIAVPIGAFADPSFPAPAISVWEERRHPWVAVPASETRRLTATPTSSLNAGSSRIGSRSESPAASVRNRSDSSIASRRCAIASAVRPARLSQHARLKSGAPYSGWRLDQLAAAIGGLGVLALVVERAERRPELPAVGLVGRAGVPPIAMIVVPGSSAKAVRFTAPAGEDERAGRRVDALAVELERRAARVHDVELLLRVPRPPRRAR